MEVALSPAMISRKNPKGFTHKCDICYCHTTRLVTTPCNHKCCANCYLKIDKCHMCRAALPQVFKIDMQICNITVPFYFCRGDINIDMILNKDMNTHDIYSILTQHNIDVNSIQPEDITIDMNDIKIDKVLSIDALNKDFAMGDKPPGVAIMHISTCYNEMATTSMAILFNNVLTLIRLAIAVESDHDCCKP